jgi:branched-chain amino acid transport system substrate-binding protein
MLRRRIALAVAVLAAAAFAPGGAARLDAPHAVPGVTATTVLLGGTLPLSGPAAAFASIGPGANAYFEYVNARGGVHRRKIVYKYLDDGYEPARTVQATRELVQQDGVFAIFNSFGTENAIAARPFLNQLKIPHLFLGTGVSDIGNGYREYPWSIGYVPSFVGEGAMYGRNIVRARPHARIAVLFENSPYGKDLLAGLKRSLAKPARIVRAEHHEPTDVDVNAQMATLKASKADTFMIFTTPQYTIQAYIALTKLDWHPLVYVTSPSVEPTIMRIATLSAGNRATNNSIAMAYLKDPTNPRWRTDKGVQLYRDIMRRFAPGRNANDIYHYYGMAVAHTMVTALRQAGRNLSRASLLRAATHLNETDNPFVLPGVAIQTSPTNYYPISKAQLYRYRNGRWQPFSGLLGARG